MEKFIPGLQLSRMCYEQVVKKIITDFFPNLQYSVGLIDYGSDALGYDTPISRDHQKEIPFSFPIIIKSAP